MPVLQQCPSQAPSVLQDSAIWIPVCCSALSFAGHKDSAAPSAPRTSGSFWRSSPRGVCPAQSILPRWGTAHKLLFLFLFPNSSRQGSWNICSELHRSLQLVCSLAVPGRMENFNQKNDLWLLLQQQKLLPDPKVRWILQPDAIPVHHRSWGKNGTE